jgi:hypothetical protein
MEYPVYHLGGIRVARVRVDNTTKNKKGKCGIRAGSEPFEDVSRTGLGLERRNLGKIVSREFGYFLRI